MMIVKLALSASLISILFFSIVFSVKVKKLQLLEIFLIFRVMMDSCSWRLEAWHLVKQKHSIFGPSWSL